MNTVAVLMSTYNGEKYIKEQIESILAQEDVSLQLFIRDDGSTDNTIQIIRSYLNNEENITLYRGKNVGVGNSFMDLLYQVDDSYDYYAFADQDDVWLTEKLIKAIEKMQNINTPALYASNQILVDKSLGYIGMRFNEKFDICYQQILCINKLSGCTMVWNNLLNDLLRDKSRRPSRELMNNRIHDVWVTMVASIVGNIYFDMNSYIKYRQHDNNVVGAQKEKWLDDLKNKIRKIRNKNERNGRSLLAKEICIHYPEYVNGYRLLVDSAVYNRIRLLYDMKEIRKYSKETTVGLAIKILVGVY